MAYYNHTSKPERNTFLNFFSRHRMAVQSG